MAVRKIPDTGAGRPPRLMIALVIAAMLLIGVASLYMVQMPGSLSSMLTSMFTF